MASLKVRDVAARLNVSEKTVYKWLSDGLIPAAKIGRTWVVSDAALDSVLSAPVAGRAPSVQGAPPRQQTPHDGNAENQRLETVDLIAGLARGAIQNGIEGVFPPRRGGDETKRAIGKALEAARGEILLHGVGLREFFGDMDYTPVLRRIVDEDRRVKLRALLVHPLSDFARARAVAEIGAQFADESTFRAGALFGDSWRSLNVIASLRRAARACRHAAVDVRFANHWPSVYVVMTPDCCFVETYHFGHTAGGPDGSSIDGLVPMLKLSADAPFYRILRNHFEYLWGGTNSYISVETLEEVAESVRVSI